MGVRRLVWWMGVLVLLGASGVPAGERAAPEGRASPSVAGRDWWGELQRAAAGCHDGWDVRVDLIGGVGRRTLGDEAASGPFGEVRMTVPLYSNRERQKARREKGTFLEHGAKVLQELEEARAKIGLKREQAAVLKQAMLQEGLQGIEAYFKLREEVARLETLAAAAELKLTGLIESCEGKKEDVAGARGAGGTR